MVYLGWGKVRLGSAIQPLVGLVYLLGSVQVVELVDVFLNISYPRCGKVRLGSVQDEAFPSVYVRDELFLVVELCDEVYLSISYPRWGKVRLGSVRGINWLHEHLTLLAELGDGFHTPYC